MVSGSLMAFLAVSLLLVLTGLAPSTKGVEFLLRGVSIPTDGSGRLLITDISLRNGQNNTSDEDALFCHATKDVTMIREVHIGDWYLETDFETTTAYGKRIDGDNDRGWTRNREYAVNVSGVYYRLVRLKRVSETAVEGKFTCHIPGDSNNNRSLLILYPILSVETVIEVVTEDQFRVHCISTGGRVLNMSVTEPHGVVSPLSNIQPVGTRRWMGNDSYSGVTGTLEGADDGDAYNCTASNGVSSATDSIVIGAVSKPVIESLERVSLTVVRVEWSQPPGGAAVTGYVLFYYDGSVTRNKSVSSTSTEITVSSATLIYVISVMALSEEPFLPRRSAWETITLCKCYDEHTQQKATQTQHLHLYMELINPNTSSNTNTVAPLRHPGSPKGVVVDGSEITSVRVSWEAVENADYYTVSFSAAVGDDQEGLCRDDSHSACVTAVDVPTASITVGGDVGSNETSSLRAYATYSVTVVAFSDKWGKTVGSEATRLTTLQRGSAAVPGRVTARSLSSTVISVQWSGLSPCRLVNGVIVRYRVQYRAQFSGLVGSKEVTGNWSSGAETELTGLTPSTNYSIAVAAVNEQGDVGDYSRPVTVRTLPGSTSKESRNSVIIGATMACIGIVLGFSGTVIGCLF
jgi:hypothetical protein